MVNKILPTSQSLIAPGEEGLNNIMAEYYLEVFSEPHILEGASFDRHGELIFTNPSGGRLLKMTSEQKIITLHTFDAEGPAGSAIHKDGRIFLALMDNDQTQGRIIALSPDGRNQEDIISVEERYIPNDLVFDDNGGFYFTDFRGTATEPVGGVYHVSANYQVITPVLRGISLANGVALSPDGMTLWVTEYGRNQLYQLNFSSQSEHQPVSSAITYRFTGPSPDSMRTDSQGNVYVSMMHHGRVLIFSPNGVPVSQILLPDRERGRNLEVASLALRSETNEIIIVSGDTEGASLFLAKGLSSGNRLYSHS